MTEDLNMIGDDYNIALLAFFITYVLFEVPSNLVSSILSPIADTTGLTATNKYGHCRLSNVSGRPSIWRVSWAYGA